MVLGLANGPLASYRTRSSSRPLIRLIETWKQSQWKGKGKAVRTALNGSSTHNAVIVFDPLVFENGVYRIKVASPIPVRIHGNFRKVAMGDWIALDHLKYSGRRWNPMHVPALETQEVYVKYKGVRKEMRERVQSRFKGDALGLYEGLLWGDTSSLSRLRLEQFRGTGLVHLLAVSGMNIVGVLLLSTMMTGALSRIPGVLRVMSSQKILLAAYGLIGIGYLLLAGFPSGLTRAYIMGGMSLVGFMSASELRAMQALFMAFLAIVLWNPSAVSEVSFQLSFLSTYAVIVSASLWRTIQKSILGLRVSGLGNYFLALGITSVFVTAMLAPYLVYLFGEAPLVSSVLNIWFIPLTEVVLFPLAVTACLFSFVFPPIGALLAWFFNIAAACFMGLMGHFYSLAWVQKASLILNLSLVHLNLFYGACLVGSFLLLKKAKAWQS